ncbi:MAG: NYN domain-containing protein [Candidatus Omnitrophica bacterium]|nr:NYN domain-containing protein [Candidatus Omnitrophota bacterium]
MDIRTEKILKSLKSKKVGVFCDDANLYHAYQKYGWRVDFGKFRKLLESYCDLQFINYYLVIPAKNDIVYRGTQKFLEKIKSFATIKEKKLKYTPVGGRIMKKGNMDVEIVLDVVRTIDDLDIIIIASGDSDFYELKNYVVKDKKKNIIFVGYEENMAWELRQCWHIYLNRIRDEVAFE